MGSGGVRSNLSSGSHASSLYGWDTSFYYFWLRSPVLDGDVDFSNDIEICDTLPDVQKQWAFEHLNRSESGLISNKYPVGWAIFQLPWFLGGHATAMILEKSGVDVRTDGFGKVYESFVYIGSLFYASLSLWLTYRLLRRFFEWQPSGEGLFVACLSGFLIYYQLNQYAMAHSVTYLCVVSAFYWTLAIREMPPLKRNWAMLGVSVGMLLLTRPQAGLYLLYPFAVAVVEIVARRATLRAASVCTVIIVAIASIQLLAWKWLYGTWLIYTYEGEGFLWRKPAIVETLFDPFHGLFYWHPAFLIGILGMLGFVVTQRNRLMWWIPVSFLAIVYLNAAWETWWYGAAFGGRAYEGATFYVCLGVAWLLAQAEAMGPKWANSLKVLLLLLVIWNVGLLEVSIYNWQSGLSMEEPITWGRFWEAIRLRWF